MHQTDQTHIHTLTFAVTLVDSGNLTQVMNIYTPVNHYTATTLYTHTHTLIRTLAHTQTMYFYFQFFYANGYITAVCAVSFLRFYTAAHAAFVYVQRQRGR